MSIWNAIFQAIVQGLTEFLPVSSSGHLSLVQHFTGVAGEEALLFSVVLHAGTLVAVFIAFWSTIQALILEMGRMVRDLFTGGFKKGLFKWSAMNDERRMILMLILSLLMLVPFVLFKDFFTSISSDSDIIVEGCCFLFTATLLFIADRCVKGNKKAGDITPKDAVIVGIFQGIALLPGVSRSGSTMGSGLLCGMEKETAVRYAFVLGIPAILGGCVLELKDVGAADLTVVGIPHLIVGFIVSGIVGFLAIKMISWLIRSNKLFVFSIYTAAIGLGAIGVGIWEIFAK
ncbi:MAG: undecaprenyl-diphosphate phosphatase [Oscillospiraceae bacterium]|nr:undecaprenyl-diphosphate phosphatase [Oscillospiraceae bacterium]